MDKTDWALLDAVQSAGNLTLSDLGRAIGLSAAPTQRRLRALERAGWIDRYVALLNEAALGLDFVVFVQVRLDRATTEAIGAFEALVEELASVVECHRTTGDFHYLMKVVAADRTGFASVAHRLGDQPSVADLRYTVSMQKTKQTTRLPIPKSW